MPEAQKPIQTETPKQAEKTASDKTKEDLGYVKPKVKLEKSEIAPGMMRPIPEQTIYEWQDLSRPYKKRSRQFFSSLFFIGILIALIFLFSRQIIAIFVTASLVFVTYVLYSVPPQKIKYLITTYGIKIEDDYFFWDELGRFWFEKKMGNQLLLVESFRFPGRITLVINENQKEIIKKILREVLIQEKPKLSMYEKMAKWLTDKIPLD